MGIIATVEAKFAAFVDKLEAEGHHLVDEGRAILVELRGDLPKLESEAEQDAADVVKTAETEGITPAVAEAEHDGVQLAEDAAHDVAAAAEGSPKTEPEAPAAQAPAEPTA